MKSRLVVVMGELLSCLGEDEYTGQERSGRLSSGSRVRKWKSRKVGK
jgi:hypothetical protein